MSRSYKHKGWIQDQSCKKFGKRVANKKVRRTDDVPKELYARHEYIKSGNSSFRSVLGKSRDTTVYESLYTRGCSDCFRLEL
jgi:hypothetical protein